MTTPAETAVPFAASSAKSVPLLLLFAASGCSALIYEVVWYQLLELAIGSTSVSLGILLAAFMGGLALGNRLFGKWADRSRHPVQAYGTLELIIGIYALLFPVADRRHGRAVVRRRSRHARCPSCF